MTSRILSGINKTFEAKKKKKQNTVNQTTTQSARLPDESIADYQERQRFEAEVRARSKARREREAREQAAKEKEAKEQAAREREAREQAAKEKEAKERAAKEKAARELAAAELEADILNRTDPSGRIEPTIPNRNLPSTKTQKKPSWFARMFARRALAVPSVAASMYYGPDVFNHALDKISGAVNNPTSKSASTTQPPSEPAPAAPSTSKPAVPITKSTDGAGHEVSQMGNKTTIDTKPTGTAAQPTDEPEDTLGAHYRQFGTLPEVPYKEDRKSTYESYLAQFKKIIDYDE